MKIMAGLLLLALSLCPVPPGSGLEKLAVVSIKHENVCTPGDPEALVTNVNCGSGMRIVAESESRHIEAVQLASVFSADFGAGKRYVPPSVGMYCGRIEHGFVMLFDGCSADAKLKSAYLIEVIRTKGGVND